MPTTAESKTLFQVFNKNRRIDDWKAIKDELLRREGKKCWICDRSDNLLHIQEFWDFDDKKHTMNKDKNIFLILLLFWAFYGYH